MLDRDSVIIGDIKAGSIAISDGAVINGFVTTTYLSKDESANEKLERLRRQKRGLMQQLLSGKKRVKINI